MAARLHPADYGASISLWRGEEVIAADFAAVVAPGAVPPGALFAWTLRPEVAPDAVAPTLRFDLDALSLPPGVVTDELYLAELRHGRWFRLPGQRNDGRTLQGQLGDGDTYALLPAPADVSGHTQQWLAHGISVQANEAAWGRLQVSAGSVSFYGHSPAGKNVTFTMAGLPVDAAREVVQEVQGQLSAQAVAATGELTWSVAAGEGRLLWLQRSVTPVIIGSAGAHSDACAQVGVRDGDVCTLSGDIVGPVMIVASDQVLDCAGHSILQDSLDHGSGVGVLVPGPAQGQAVLDGVVIVNCVIGAPGEAFWQGILVDGATDAVVMNNVLADNRYGVTVLATQDAQVLGNEIISADYGTGIQALSYPTTGTVISDNTVTLGYAAVGIELSGMTSGEILPVSASLIAYNTIVGGASAGGLLLRIAEDNHIKSNTMQGDGQDPLGVGVSIGDYGWPNALWWNSIEAAQGAHVLDGAAELSHAQQGNWWGHACPNALFVAGVDSNELDVVDSYPYAGPGYWHYGAAPGCDTTPPDPPQLDAPAAATTVIGLRPVFAGSTEPFALVTFSEGQDVIGALRASADGTFIFVPEEDLDDGAHTITLTAMDYAGNTSTATTRSFSLLEVSPTQPLWNGDNTFAVTAVVDSPNPFFSPTESHQIRVNLDATNARAGAPPSRVYFALSRRVIVDPDTAHEVWRSTVAAEVSHAAPDQVELRDAWDGMDSTLDQMAAAGRAYPVEMEIIVGRPAMGRCGPGETAMTFTDADINALMMALPSVQWSLYPTGCITTRMEWSLANLAPRLRILATIPPWNPITSPAKNCVEGHLACLESPLAYYDNGNRCLDCSATCDYYCGPQRPATHDCFWPTRTHWGNKLPCNYFSSSPVVSPKWDMCLLEEKILTDCYYACYYQTGEDDPRPKLKELCFREQSSAGTCQEVVSRRNSSWTHCTEMK